MGRQINCKYCQPQEGESAPFPGQHWVMALGQRPGEFLTSFLSFSFFGKLISYLDRLGEFNHPVLQLQGRTWKPRFVSATALTSPPKRKLSLAKKQSQPLNMRDLHTTQVITGHLLLCSYCMPSASPTGWIVLYLASEVGLS